MFSGNHWQKMFPITLIKNITIPVNSRVTRTIICEKENKNNKRNKEHFRFFTVLGNVGGKMPRDVLRKARKSHFKE